MSSSQQKDTQRQFAPRNLNQGPHVSYMARRETHSSRAITSVVSAIVIIALMAYLATEGILGMLGKKPLLMSWSEMTAYLVKLPDPAVKPVLIIIGIVLAFLGLFLLAKALRPGPLDRHMIEDKRCAYIIDDAVIASAVSQATRKNAGLSQGQVTTEVKRRSLTTTITPTSGLPLDQLTLKQDLSAEVDQYNLKPNPKVNVSIRKQGVVSK